jgi:hypothetical protein
MSFVIDLLDKYELANGGFGFGFMYDLHSIRIQLLFESGLEL